MEIEETVMRLFRSLDIYPESKNDFLRINLGMDSQEILMLLSLIKRDFGVNIDYTSLKEPIAVKDIISLVSEIYV